MTPTLASSPLTVEIIEEAIANLPIQGRIILRLLLLQYLDVTQDEILFMVADRPDPRCVSGKKPVTTMTQESIMAMVDRRNEYRRRARLRRERTWLQCVALEHLIKTASAFAARAAVLLTDRGVSSETIAALSAQARSAVPSTTLRILEQQWEKDEISAEEYLKHRLVVEMQMQLRFVERFRKRLALAERERRTSDSTTLQDHEIGHIWGIPAGTLAARKVKFLSLYLLATQARCSDTPVSGSPVPSPEIWQTTLRTLSQTPIERSIATYDGLEGTESALIEKLEIYAMMGISEATETKFWNSLVYGASSSAIHTETTRTLFGLQRLVSIQKDLDTSNAALDEELLKRSMPTPKAGDLPSPSTESGQGEITDFQRHILHNFVGEDVSGRSSDKW